MDHTSLIMIAGDDNLMWSRISNFDIYGLEILYHII